MCDIQRLGIQQVEQRGVKCPGTAQVCNVRRYDREIRVSNGGVRGVECDDREVYPSMGRYALLPAAHRWPLLAEIPVVTIPAVTRTPNNHERVLRTYAVPGRARSNDGNIDNR